MTTTRETPSTGGALTEDELKADLTVDQLKQLVGLVEYDEEGDVFPVTGWDAIVFCVGNATQTAHYYQSAWGMQLEAYSGPENGNRDHKSFVLRSGSIRFVVNGAVDPDSPLVEHHRKHGDGVTDIALEVPDVDKCIAQAVRAGARVVREAEDVTDEHGTVRVAAIATYGDTVHSLDPDMPVEHVQTLEALRTNYLAPTRLTAMLLGLFAGVALVVTLAGLTGVIGMSVSQRTQEFGVRMALGAQPGSILTGVVRQGLVMVALGLAIGGVASMFVGRFFTSYLYETQATDPATFGVLAIALLAAAAVACAGPARRATQVDPMLALRSE